MEVGSRLTFSAAACQINGMSVPSAPSFPRGNPRVYFGGQRWGRRERWRMCVCVLQKMSQQKRKKKHFIAGAEKLPALSHVSRLSAIRDGTLGTNSGKKWLPICRRCLRRCHFMKGDGLNAGEEEQRGRGGKLSWEPEPWRRREAFELSSFI